MGHTLLPLANKKLNACAIFNNRFVVEIAETVHVHYRNLRINLSLTDWISMAQGMSDALKRWKDRGSPEPAQGTHIELCRKEVVKYPIDLDICKVNLNKNLYLQHDGKIFAEGAGLEDEQYIHLKIRDLRIELTKEDFKVLAEAVKEASDVI
jgi:hypothetical protein